MNFKFFACYLGLLLPLCLWAQVETRIKNDKKEKNNNQTVASTTISAPRLTPGGDPGGLSGLIKDLQDQSPLYGVRLIIVGTSIGAFSDEEGKFLIKNVLPGKYDLIFSMVSYAPDTLKNVEVKSGLITNLDLKLRPADMIVKTIEITAQRVQISSEISMLSQMRTSQMVTSNISSEMIGRSQDRDAAEVMRRVPGVTVINNRFVMVRGLNERYNVTFLNSNLAPSSEADKRAFSFDLIPSNLIDNMTIYKTPSPELPGDFAGGVIKIRTKGAPEVPTLQCNLQLGYRTGTTLQDFTNTKGSPTDWLGYDNGYRHLPSTFPPLLRGIDVTPEQLVAAAKSLPNDNWKLNTITANPDMRISFSYGNSWQGKKIRVSNLTAVNYSNNYSTFTIERHDYDGYWQQAPDGSIQDPQALYSYTDSQFTNNRRIGLLQQNTLSFNPRHRLEMTHFFNQSGMSQITTRSGSTSAINGQLVERQDVNYNYISRSLYSGQLAGFHRLKEETFFKWHIGQTYSNRDQPDYRRLNKIKDPSDPTSVFQWELGNIPSPNFTGRFYSYTEEVATTAAGDFETKFDVGNSNILLKAGIFYETKRRFFRARWMGYVPTTFSLRQDLRTISADSLFRNENLGTETGLMTMLEGTNPSDSYTASNNLKAGYLGVQWSFLNEKLIFNGGVRREDNTQILRSFEIGQQSNLSETEFSYPIVSWLPSINISYNFSERMLVRWGYGKTINRPEFRELAPFAFYDFDFSVAFQGKPTLGICTIDNADLRWEFYPTLAEVVSVGGFYKKFKNPIEQVLIPTGSGRAYTFTNAPGAVAFGFEVEIRKNLGFIAKNISLLQNFSIGFNASYIQSEIDLGDAAIDETRVRIMQGQSPYVFNGGLFYAGLGGKTQINLLYNVFGKRIFIVGSEGYPDVYELPRHLVDFNITQRIGNRFELRFGIQDLLNQSYVLTQDTNRDRVQDRKKDKFIMSFKPGSIFTLGLTVKL